MLLTFFLFILKRVSKCSAASIWHLRLNVRDEADDDDGMVCFSIVHSVELKVMMAIGSEVSSEFEKYAEGEERGTPR